MTHMRRVRVLQPMTGLGHVSGSWSMGEFTWNPGDEVELPDDLAAALCERPPEEPRAEYADRMETAMLGAPENTSRPRGRPRSG